MKKIGLCIKYQNRNYGSMLQTRAFLSFLNQLHIDFEIIRYQKKRTVAAVIKNLPRFFNTVFLNDRIEVMKKTVGLKLHPAFAKANATRNALFDAYCREMFVPLSPVYKGYGELSEQSSRYQIVVSGSDQIWSPAALGSNFYNLAFCREGVKRISYASSFGVSNIPWFQVKRTKNYLTEMDCISVRENSGANIIKELTGKDVAVVCDPVLLLTKQEWDALIPNRQIIDQKYIFAYFLGATKEYREKVTEFAKKQGLALVALHHLDQYVKADEAFGDYAPYDVGPDEFLNLLRNAEYVFTDSFHGSCFSILNHKRFLTFNRYAENSRISKNTRIDTLMQTIGIDRRWHGAADAVLEEIDYAGVDERLKKLTGFSKRYLCDALEVEYDTDHE